MLFKCKNAVFNGEQEKESIFCEKVGLLEKSVPRDHRLSSISKPCDAN